MQSWCNISQCISVCTFTYNLLVIKGHKRGSSDYMYMYLLGKKNLKKMNEFLPEDTKQNQIINCLKCNFVLCKQIVLVSNSRILAGLAFGFLVTARNSCISTLLYPVWNVHAQQRIIILTRTCKLCKVAFKN